jgi:formate hydrogenlyase subunit 3/multisubunit Na+/H+ antiporter MnhD subunit
MNAPLFFILAPACLAVPAYYYYLHRPREAIFLSSLSCLLLSLFSFFITLDRPFSLLGFMIPVAHSFPFVGREFSFEAPLRPILGLLFLSVSAFILGGLVVRLDRFFLPVSLTTLSLFAAALFVQPFLYAAFFLFFIACLFSLLLFSGSRFENRASTRLLSYSLLSVPFLLMAGSYFALSASTPLDDSALRISLILLSVGFSLLLTLPPMHVWLLDAVDAANSYSFFFILAIFSTATFIFILRFFNEFEWLRHSGLAFEGFHWLGIFLCIVGSAFAIIQNRIGRLVVYLSLIPLGCLFLALSTQSAEGLDIVFAFLFIRVFLFLLCGFCLSQLRLVFKNDLFSTTRGLFYQLPFTSICLFITLLSMVGFPGFLSFPSFWATLRVLSTQPDSLEISLSVVLLAMAFGTMAIFNAVRFLLPVMSSQSFETVETRFYQFIIFSALLLLILFSIFPQAYFPAITNAASSFSNLWRVQ